MWKHTHSFHPSFKAAKDALSCRSKFHPPLLLSTLFVAVIIIGLVALSPLSTLHHARRLVIAGVHASPNQDLPSAWPPPGPNYTIIVNTFRRPELLRDLLQRLNADNCPSLESIIVSWADIEAPLPDFLTDGTFARYPVEISTPRSSSLNERFRVPSSLKTDAVLQIDDDLRIPCDDLEFAFQTWHSEYSDRLVGYSPRSHAKNKDDGSWEYYLDFYANPPESGYSMILTNAAFVHRRYLDAYFSERWMPAGVRELVSERRNCEDIAMNFMVAAMNGKPPVYVGGSFTSLQVEGISTGSSHLATRHSCMNDFAKLFGGMPLDATLTLTTRKIVRDLKDQTRWVKFPSR